MITFRLRRIAYKASPWFVRLQKTPFGVFFIFNENEQSEPEARGDCRGVRVFGGDLCHRQKCRPSRQARPSPSAPAKEWGFFYFFTIHFSLRTCRLSNRVIISENIALRRKNITPNEVWYLSTGNEAEYITKIMFYVKWVPDKSGRRRATGRLSGKETRQGKSVVFSGREAAFRTGRKKRQAFEGTCRFLVNRNIIPRYGE